MERLSICCNEQNPGKVFEMNANSPIVLLGPRMTDDSVSIWRTCLDLGWTPIRLQGWRIPADLVIPQSQVIIYGEPLFAEAVADQLGLALLEPSVDWLTNVPERYLQRRVELLTLGEARALADKAFVKPADGKIFDPKVYNSGADLPTDQNVDMDIQVLRSGVVDFRLEVRCFVRSRQVVSLSPYWRDDNLALDAEGLWPFHEGEEAEAKAFAEAVLKDPEVPLPPACTLDVGRLRDGSWAVVEANPCWGAGLYGSDPKQVLVTIKDAIIRKEDVTMATKPWISKRRTFLTSSAAE